MTEEILETIILGHIAKELKDEIQIGRQVNIAKTIIQALRMHYVVERSERLVCDYKLSHDAFKSWHDANYCPYCGVKL